MACLRMIMFIFVGVVFVIIYW